MQVRRSYCIIRPLGLTIKLHFSSPIIVRSGPELPVHPVKSVSAGRGGTRTTTRVNQIFSAEQWPRKRHFMAIWFYSSRVHRHIHTHVVTTFIWLEHKTQSTAHVICVAGPLMSREPQSNGMGKYWSTRNILFI